MACNCRDWPDFLVLLPDRVLLVLGPVDHKTVFTWTWVVGLDGSARGGCIKQVRRAKQEMSSQLQALATQLLEANWELGEMKAA